MKRTPVVLHTMVDLRIYENAPNQEILAQWSTDIFIDIIDSFAPKNEVVQPFIFKISGKDLSAGNSITFTHDLGMYLKIILYNHQNKRVYVPWFDFQPLTETTAKLTITGSIPLGKFIRGCFYKIA